MRGADEPQSSLFNDVSVEDRISADHPLRTIHTLVDSILTALSPKFEALCSRMGRPPTPPERLLRALLLLVLCTVRSARHLMEQVNYNLLFRWEQTVTRDCLDERRRDREQSEGPFVDVDAALHS